MFFYFHINVSASLCLDFEAIHQLFCFANVAKPEEANRLFIIMLRNMSAFMAGAPFCNWIEECGLERCACCWGDYGRIASQLESWKIDMFCEHNVPCTTVERLSTDYAAVREQGNGKQALRLELRGAQIASQLFQGRWRSVREEHKAPKRHVLQVDQQGTVAQTKWGATRLHGGLLKRSCLELRTQLRTRAYWLRIQVGSLTRLWRRQLGPFANMIPITSAPKGKERQRSMSQQSGAFMITTGGRHGETYRLKAQRFDRLRVRPESGADKNSTGGKCSSWRSDGMVFGSLTFFGSRQTIGWSVNLLTTCITGISSAIEFPSVL